MPDSGRVSSHSGGLLVQGSCDKLGLTDAITNVFGLRRLGTIPRGAVLRDLAVAIADGGDAVIAVESLRAQRAAFGEVASDSTVWRTLGEFDEDRRDEFRRMLGAAREQVWADPRAAQHLGRLLCIDVDGTLVTAHSPKELAAGTYKGGFGFHPIVVALDATREPLAILQRAGNAGANCAQDLIDALTLGLAQLPARAHDRALHQLVVRMDSGGHSHKVVSFCHAHGLDFVIGSDLTTDVWQQIGQLNETAWVPAIDQSGVQRDHAHVAELPAPEGWVARALRTGPHYERSRHPITMPPP